MYHSKTKFHTQPATLETFQNSIDSFLLKVPQCTKNEAVWIKISSVNNYMEIAFSFMPNYLITFPYLARPLIRQNEWLFGSLQV